VDACFFVHGQKIILLCEFEWQLEYNFKVVFIEKRLDKEAFETKRPLLKKRGV
jgi:hypothetical protein